MSLQEESSMGFPGQRPQQHPDSGNHCHMRGRIASCKHPPCRRMSPCQCAVPWQAFCRGLLNFLLLHYRMEFISSVGLGQHFSVMAQSGEKCGHTSWHSQGCSALRDCPDISRGSAQIQSCISYDLYRGTFGKTICRHGSLPFSQN